MGCGDERSIWDRDAVGRSGRGQNTLLDPKMITAMETFKGTRPARRSEARAALHQASAQRLLPILANPQHRAYPPLQQKLAAAVGGREKMTDEEYDRLPRAFYVVLQDHPDAMGIFRAMPSYYGPGASAIQEPYEILGAAALMTKPRPTSLGRALSITPQDRVDFGLKTAKGFFQPQRYGTIEFDIVVQKPGGVPGIDPGRVVGIDAKHTRTTTYDSTNGLMRQLEGIRNSFNHGRVHEFYYVSNGQFGSGFRELVDRTNLNLVKDRLREINAKHFAPDPPVPIANLTAAERAALPLERIDPDDLKLYDDAVRTLAERCDVPQIGLCERVVFDG